MFMLYAFGCVETCKNKLYQQLPRRYFKIVTFPVRCFTVPSKPVKVTT